VGVYAGGASGSTVFHPVLPAPGGRGTGAVGRSRAEHCWGKVRMGGGTPLLSIGIGRQAQTPLGLGIALGPELQGELSGVLGEEEPGFPV
jgi:hypothetical protein